LTVNKRCLILWNGIV